MRHTQPSSTATASAESAVSTHAESEASRRTFLAATTAGIAAAGVLPGVHAAPAAYLQKKDIVVGVMGVSRGLSLARTFAAVDGVRVKYLCDTDNLRLKAAHESLTGAVKYEVQTTGDFRRILEDAEVDALICAPPNHWHAPAAIMACAAGKHCYVEKPCSHNPHEGELLIQAARKHKRCVQMGNQRRSSEPIANAIRMMHYGRIGRVYYSRSWYANLRGDIGKGTPAEVPPHVDYDMWQGPAPRQPFTSNRLHYNWHWVWHYGNGELGNNGIHSIDLSRWGLQADYPHRVVSSGGRYRFDDDQQTADTHIVSFEFDDDRQIIWEGLSCNKMGMYSDGFGVTFHGENGSLKLTSWGYEFFDAKGKSTEAVEGKAADQQHAENFVAAIRANDPTMLHSEIEEGHKSTMLCHLGNIAHRTGDTIRCDSANGHIIGNAAAAALWKREYEPGWEPTV